MFPESKSSSQRYSLSTFLNLSQFLIILILRGRLFHNEPHGISTKIETKRALVSELKYNINNNYYFICTISRNEITIHVIIKQPCELRNYGELIML